MDRDGEPQMERAGLGIPRQVPEKELFPAAVSLFPQKFAPLYLQEQGDDDQLVRNGLGDPSCSVGTGPGDRAD